MIFLLSYLLIIIFALVSFDIINIYLIYLLTRPDNYVIYLNKVSLMPMSVYSKEIGRDLPILFLKRDYLRWIRSTKRY